MRRHKLFPILLLASFVLLGTACTTFVVKDVNYSHQIESVLTPDQEGEVSDVRHGITFNVQPFVDQEFGEEDSTYQIEEIRMIRNAKGFYFITADQFKHVYVMKPGSGSLKLKSKIKVSESPITNPAFNMRDGYVQLVKTQTNEVVALTEDGLQNEKEEEEQS